MVNPSRSPDPPEGLIIDLVTPLTGDGGLDATGLDRLLARVLPAGDGLLAAAPLGPGRTPPPALPGAPLPGGPAPVVSQQPRPAPELPGPAGGNSPASPAPQSAPGGAPPGGAVQASEYAHPGLQEISGPAGYQRPDLPRGDAPLPALPPRGRGPAQVCLL